MKKSRIKQADNPNLFFLQWHQTADAPDHGRLSLSIIPAEKASAAALTAALARTPHEFTTLFCGTESQCLQYRRQIDAMDGAQRSLSKKQSART